MASADPAGALVTLASPTWTIFTTASGAGAFTGTFDGIVGGVTPAAATATTIVGTDTTDSTTSITGALKTAGGLGVAKREDDQGELAICRQKLAADDLVAPHPIDHCVVLGAVGHLIWKQRRRYPAVFRRLTRGENRDDATRAIDQLEVGDEIAPRFFGPFGC